MNQQGNTPATATNKSMSNRFVNAVTWRIGSNLVLISFQLAQTLILFRLIPVEAFGIYGYAKSIALMTLVVAQFGFGPAFIHRDAETEDEQASIRVFFSVSVIFATSWMLAMILVAFLFFADPLYRWSIITFSLSQYLIQLCMAPRLILNRRVVHRRLSIIDTIISSMTALVAITLAIYGYGIRTLIIADLVRGLLFIILHYGYKPVWRPQFSWKKSTVQYYLKFGFKSFSASGLLPIIDRLDDFWVAQYLGATTAGFYNRSYALARYPKLLLSTAVDNVILGAYSELKYDRQKLSSAFFNANAFLIRIGFLLAGLMAVLAEDGIRLIGEQWLPMQPIFQIMLLFVLFDPLQKTVFSLFHALGKPELLVRLRIVQIIIFVTGLFSLGTLYGSIGVALSVDIVVLLGVGYGLFILKEYIDFSVKKLFFWPCVLSASGIALAFFISWQPWFMDIDQIWFKMFLKSGAVVSVYAILLAVEYQDLRKTWMLIRNRMP